MGDGDRLRDDGDMDRSRRWTKGGEGLLDRMHTARWLKFSHVPLSGIECLLPATVKVRDEESRDDVSAGIHGGVEGVNEVRRNETTSFK